MTNPIRDFVESRKPDLLKKSDKQEIGIAGFVAYVALNESEMLSSTSPDIVLEDGTSIADTIFLRPDVITIEGEVADVYISRQKSDEVYRGVNNVIGQITPYLPNRTNSQIDKVQEIADSARNAYSLIEDAINKGDQLLNIFRNDSGTLSNQDVFLDRMRSIHKTKQLIDIETSLKVYRNMRIENIEFRKDNTSNKIMFKLSAKEIRQQQLRFTRVGSNASKGLGGQAESAVNKNTQGEEVDQSLLSFSIDSIRGLFN